MKVHLTLDVDAAARFVIARYFGIAAPLETTNRTRSRATRKQVRRFAIAAVRTAVMEQRENLSGRSRAVAQRLFDGGGHVAQETLTPPAEQQQGIPWA